MQPGHDATQLFPAVVAGKDRAATSLISFFEKCQQVNKWVFEIVERYQGSVSAEHGVGMTKKPYLQYTRSEAEIAYLRGIKQVFDPNNIMNPGKIFD